MAYDFLAALNQAMGIQTATSSNPVTYVGSSNNNPLPTPAPVNQPTNYQYIQGKDGKSYNYNDYAMVYGKENVDKALAAKELIGLASPVGQVQSYAPGALKSFYDAPAASSNVSTIPSGPYKTAKINGIDKTVQMVNGVGYIDGKKVTDLYPGIQWNSTSSQMQSGGAYGYYTLPTLQPIAKKTSTETPLLPTLQPVNANINMNDVLSSDQIMAQIKALIPQAPSLQNYQMKQFDDSPTYSTTSKGTSIRSLPTLGARQRWEAQEQMNAAATEAANKAALDQYGTQVSSATNILNNYIDNARAIQVAQKNADADAVKLAAAKQQQDFENTMAIYQQVGWNGLTSAQQQLLIKAGVASATNPISYQNTQSQMADRAADNKLAASKAATAATAAKKTTTAKIPVKEAVNNLSAIKSDISKTKGMTYALALRTMQANTNNLDDVRYAQGIKWIEDMYGE